MKFHKKPVVIEAFQMTASYRGNRELWPEWANEAFNKGSVVGGIWWSDFDNMMVGTLEGVLRVEVYDWIIRGVQGELYPCKPDIFAMTYEPEFIGEGERSGLAGGGGGS